MSRRIHATTIICLLMVMILSFAGSSPAEAATGIKSSKKVTFGRAVSVNMTEKEHDYYYKITVPEYGRVSVSLKNTDITVGSDYDGVLFYFTNLNGVNVEDEYMPVREMNEVYSKEIKLYPGDYYFHVYTEYGKVQGKYEFTVDYDEIEFCGSVSDNLTECIPFNLYISSSLIKSSHDDYFRIDLPKKTTVKINTRLTDVRSEYSGYTVRITNLNGVTIACNSLYPTDLKHMDKIQTYEVELKAGSYLLNVFSDSLISFDYEVMVEVDLKTQSLPKVSEPLCAVLGTNVICGKAAFPNAKVTVKYDKKTYKATADSNGVYYVVTNSVIEEGKKITFSQKFGGITSKKRTVTVGNR